MKFKTENKLLSAFSYASLTDVVLQLLIFFLISSSFVVHPGIKVQLPKAEVGETETKRDIIITLTDQGAMYLNSEQVSTETLGGKLFVTMQGRSDFTIIINADKAVNLQSAVQVMDIAKGVGASRFMIATQPNQ